MLSSLNKDGFIKSLFSEPNKSLYAIPNDLAIENDLVWVSHKTDSKNLANDYSKIRKSLNKAFTEYKNRKNG